MTKSVETAAGNPGAQVNLLAAGPAPRRRMRLVTVPRATVGVLAAIVLGAGWFVFGRSGSPAVPPAVLPPEVTVSQPLQRDVGQWAGFLGQFAAVDHVDLRAQVGGTLTEIHFRDGQIVHRGDLLFVIDPRPYEIKAAEEQAEVQSAEAKLGFSSSELWRAQQLKQTTFGTAETVDQRTAEQRDALASLALAQAVLADAELDISYTHLVAPFTGRIGAHLVSVGSLVTGNRGGTTGTTLLGALVSLDPIYLNFYMSEADYLAFSRARARFGGPLTNMIAFSLGDEDSFTHRGTLDFVDNAIDKASGTILARATVENHNLLIVPGEFARVRLALAPPAPALLVPDAAIIPDQSQSLVMTVAADGTVVPKIVTTGALRGGLRVINAGLAPTDRVIIDGLVRAMPGAKVAPEAGVINFDSTDNGRD